MISSRSAGNYNLREELDDNIVQYPTDVPNPDPLAGPPKVS
jgi:hypothetical protein